MKQKIKSLINLKTTSASLGLLFFVLLAGGMTIDIPRASAAQPTMVAATTTTGDTDNDGIVDQITITFSEAVNIDDGNAADGLTSLALGDSCVIPNADYSNASTTTLVISGLTGCSSGAGSTGITPTVTYTAVSDCTTAGSICDVATTTQMANAHQIISTDAAAPILTAVVLSSANNRNVLTFTYSENVTVTNGASTTTKGDITTAGTVAGFGSFATAGNTTVPTTKNTTSGSGTSSITVTLANETAGYLNSVSTSEPSGVFTPVASAEVVDAVSLQVNTSATAPTATSGSSWDLTKPDITSVTISDAAGSNGRVDRAVVVLSEAMRDANITNGDATLGGGSGTFTSGAANDNTTTFNLTADDLVVDTSATAAQFNYFGATTKITDLAGNLLDTATDGAIADDDVTETDGASPVVTNISSTTADGSYKAGVTIAVTAAFSESVIVTGTPQILLETGTMDRQSSYEGGSTTAILTLNYTVQAGDTSSDLDYVATTSFTLNSGTILDSASNAAVLTLATPGAATSLGANKAIIIDTTAPTNQDTVFASDASQTGGGSVTIVSSGDVTNNVWFAPSGTTSFSAGATMTTAGGTAATIIVPTTAGSYKLFVIDLAGNASAESTATLTVDNTAPTITFSPVSGTTGVAIDSAITLTFSEAMRLINDSAITDPTALITLKKTNVSGDNVSFSAAINAGKTIITVTPSANLNYGQLYYVAIGATIEDSSNNAISASSATFTTLNAGIGFISTVPTSTTGQAAATPDDGGVISKTNIDGTGAKVVLPAGALTANAVITISPITKAEAVASMPAPSGRNIVGDYAYNFTAVSGLNTAVNTFEKALTLTFTYTNEQTEGLNEGMLKIHYWDKALNQWVALEDSVVNTANKTVTATTTHFTYFAVIEGQSSKIVDGDIIQCQSSSNPFAVYIVKVVGNTKYIRHIVSLEIFNYYGHLKWENLKQVDSLNNYSLSGWVRYNTGLNGTAVYEINGDQTKHWINMTAEDFLLHGGSDAAIYSVNQGELNLYTTGPDVMML
ncbi:MAG: hypothetical protein GWP10_09845 [Nitrospiraceae bacterium]|nr:hypothetical protein [Nitrospiraceae bacterium]